MAGKPLPKLKTLGEEWAGFLATVVPKNAPEIQRNEMRTAFFAGAWAAVCQFERVGEPDISEEDAFCHMTAWRDACVAFEKELRRRHAEGN